MNNSRGFRRELQCAPTPKRLPMHPLGSGVVACARIKAGPRLSRRRQLRLALRPRLGIQIQIQRSRSRSKLNPRQHGQRPLAPSGVFLKKARRAPLQVRSCLSSCAFFVRSRPTNCFADSCAQNAATFRTTHRGKPAGGRLNKSNNAPRHKHEVEPACCRSIGCASGRA